MKNVMNLWYDFFHALRQYLKEQIPNNNVFDLKVHTVLLLEIISLVHTLVLLIDDFVSTHSIQLNIRFHVF